MSISVVEEGNLQYAGAADWRTLVDDVKTAVRSGNLQRLQAAIAALEAMADAKFQANEIGDEFDSTSNPYDWN